MKRKLFRVLRLALLVLMDVAAGAATGAAVGAWAIPCAYNFRGYSAVGGEWLLILLVAFITMWGTYRLYRLVQKRKHGGEITDAEMQAVPSCLEN